MIDYEVIGRKIGYYRKKNGLTQAVFSEMLGISESYISQIERGTTKVSLARLDEISEILKIDIAVLLSHNIITPEVYVNTEICELISDWPKDKIDFLIRLIICANEQFRETKKQ